MIGHLLALPVRIVNTPARLVEKVVARMSGEKDMEPGDRILSVPLESLAEALEEIDGR